MKRKLKAKRIKRPVCPVCGVQVQYVVARKCDFCSQPAPAVGMGVTFGCWTDRHPGTIISVSASGKTIVVQEDRKVRIDANGMSESQEYEYHANPNGPCRTYRLTTRWGYKAWRSGIYTARLGKRRAFQDFTF